jgi:hypothetical protein
LRARRIKSQRDHNQPDDHRSGSHPPEELSDAFGFASGRIERRLRATASSHQHHDENYNEQKCRWSEAAIHPFT